MGWVIRKIKASLKQGLEILEKGLAQQLKNKNRDAIRARGFVRFCL
jgi:hypothetical protein